MGNYIIQNASKEGRRLIMKSSKKKTEAAAAIGLAPMRVRAQKHPLFVKTHD